MTAQFTLNYDINLMYQAFASTMSSLWPIVAPAFAIMLAGAVMAGIIAALRWYRNG